MPADRTRTGRPPRRSLTTALVTILGVIASAVVVLVGAVPAGAVLGEKPLVTYNMQGAAGGTDASKWTTTVGGYVERAEIVALQEAGPTPPGVAQPDVAIVPFGGQLPAAGRASVVQHSRWQVGFAEYEVYFLQTDAQAGRYVGGRVNTALVTQRQADEVTVVVNPNPAGRPALGVRFGDTWYFSFHALTGGGGDSAGMLGQVAAFVAARPNPEHWVVLGDFNRDPDALAANAPAGAQVYAARDGNGRPLPTHQSGGAYDYAVASENVNGITADRLAGATADHYAFALGQLRGGAEPRIRFHSDRAIESMQAGGVLDVARERTANASEIISFHRTGGANQAWTPEFYADNTVRFRGRGSQRCVDIHNSTSAAAGRELVLWGCTDQASQRWHVDAAGNGEVSLRSVLRPDLCMDVEGAPRVPDAGNIIVWNCKDSANQRWLLTAADASTDLDRQPIDLSANYPEPVTLESMQAGGVLDVARERTANASEIISFHRTGGTNQGFYPDWYGSTEVRLRGVASNRCVDVHNSESATAGRELVLWDCTDQASQRWRPEQLDNGQVLMHNVSRPDLCMNVADAPDTPDAGNIILWPCGADRNMQFLLTAFDPTGTPEPDHPHTDL